MDGLIRNLPSYLLIKKKKNPLHDIINSVLQMILKENKHFSKICWSLQTNPLHTPLSNIAMRLAPTPPPSADRDCGLENMHELHYCLLLFGMIQLVIMTKKVKIKIYTLHNNNITIKNNTSNNQHQW